MKRRIHRLTVLLAVVLSLTTSCTRGEPLPTRTEIEDMIQTAVTDVADVLGSDVSYTRERWADCVVGQPQHGEDYVYTLHLHSHYDTFEEVMQEAWPQLEAAGWVIRDDPPRPDFFRFHRDGLRMVVNYDGLAPSDTVFVLTGTTGCLIGVEPRQP